MLSATLEGDTATIEALFEKAHETETGALAYNNEAELDALVRLVYLSARDFYRMEREDKAGKGFVDFIFYPKNPKEDAIIIEVKVDDSAENALKQIKKKNYKAALEGKLGETMYYTGRILAVAIVYDRKEKKHTCLIETLREKLDC